MLGARIRSARMERGFSLAQLGEAVGVTLQQFQKYESGETRLTVSTLYRIAGALHVEMDQLLADLGKPEARPGAPDPEGAEAFLQISIERINAQLRSISDPNSLNALEHIATALARSRRRKGNGAAPSG